MTLTTSRADLVEDGARIAVLTDLHGLVIDAEGVDEAVLAAATRRALNDSPAKASTSFPNWGIERLDGRRIAVRLTESAADQLDNSEQWEAYRALRDILMGRTGSHASIAQRIEGRTDFRRAVTIQEVPFGAVVYA